MYRLGLFACSLLVVSVVGVAQQPPTKGQYDPPKAIKPNDATLKLIAEKSKQLADVVRTKSITDPDVLVYLKAAEYIVAFQEWLHKDAGAWTVKILDTGLQRANNPGTWHTTTRRWVSLGYRSTIDGSIQPYAVQLPADFFTKKQPRRLDVVLHGRDASLTEVKFLNSHDGAKESPADVDAVILEVYGRGNNAYRWAGESDVFEAIEAFRQHVLKVATFDPIDTRRVVLRGFSMGGAGTWHLGLHHPSKFAVLGPGAGFTDTKRYIAKFPQQPDYIDKCLHIYDAVDYAENAFNVPIVAYSGELDKQKAAADQIEAALKGFAHPLKFQHIIAPGLEHKQPPEWQAKLETQYRKFTEPGRTSADEIRFVTYTPAYGLCDWVGVLALEKQYEKATVVAKRTAKGITIETTNVRGLQVISKKLPVTWNGDVIEPASDVTLAFRTNGKLRATSFEGQRIKDSIRPGPIDDAFRHPFVVRKPSGTGYHSQTSNAIRKAHDDFSATWKRFFRGELPTTSDDSFHSEILFGDPASNPRIAELIKRLPVTWTKDVLAIGGEEYPAANHYVAIIYPHPNDKRRYVVLNSGHTFTAADLRGTNALLYPRLGDWAVMKVDEKGNTSVAAAGLFDEDWRFSK